MPYDPELALRLSNIFQAHEGVSEKKMFGGLAFMLSGHMCCGVIDDKLMARVGPEAYEAALGLPHARPMDFTGKPLKGFVYVDAEGLNSDEKLREWVNRAVAFVASLPPK